MPYAALGRCSEPGCPELALPTGRGRCGDHLRVGWEGRASSTERYGLSGSAQQSLHQRVLREAGWICYVCGLPGATEVDHVIPIHLGGARTDRSNLGAIHSDPCHADKTKRENAERRAARAAAKAQAAALASQDASTDARDRRRPQGS